MVDFEGLILKPIQVMKEYPGILDQMNDHFDQIMNPAPNGGRVPVQRVQSIE